MISETGDHRDGSGALVSERSIALGPSIVWMPHRQKDSAIQCNN